MKSIVNESLLERISTESGMEIYTIRDTSREWKKSLDFSQNLVQKLNDLIVRTRKKNEN